MGKRRLARASSGEERRQAKAKWTTCAVVIGALIAVSTIQSGATAAEGEIGVARVGSPAPDFTLPLLNGQSVSVSSLRGKPVLVNFWHSA